LIPFDGGILRKIGPRLHQRPKISRSRFVVNAPRRGALLDTGLPCIRSGGVAVGALLLTPYLFVWDTICATLLLLIFPFINAPLGLAAASSPPP
jgi:hypothetical protein